jgi:hypothetical protein
MKYAMVSCGALALCACSASKSAPDASGGDPPADAAPAVDQRTDGAGSASERPDAAPSTTVDASVADAPAEAGAAAWPAVTDYAARGPFPITRESNTGPNGMYDIFRPSQLAEQGRRHPIISWANGTLFDIGDYQKLLEHWASHGFVVIAGHTNSTAGGATHKAGIDWLLAENGRAGSAYRGVIDATKIGAAGHSQGGGATIAAGSNKPGPTGIVATLPLMPLLSFESDKTIVSRQTAPMFNINASMDDRDPSGAVANQIFTGAMRELVQASYIGIHEDAMNVTMFRPTLAWFRAHLMGDERARPLFYPSGTCGLCQEPAWKQVRHKNTP